MNVDEKLPAGMDELIARFKSTSFRYSTEDELQRGIAEMLEQGQVRYEREKRLSPEDRIDFWLPDYRIGIECKTCGSVQAVTRQLMRYARSDEIVGLVLATTQSKHWAIPFTLNNKPVVVRYVVEI